MLITDVYASETPDSGDIIAITEVESTPKSSEYFQSGWTSIVPMIFIFVVLYFFLIRPQEKRRQQQESLVNSVKKGEQVVTSSGMYGTVTKISDDGTVEIELAKDVVVKMLKSAVVDIISRKIEAKDKKEVKDNQDKKDRSKSAKKSV